MMNLSGQVGKAGRCGENERGKGRAKGRTWSGGSLTSEKEAFVG